jgi:acetyl esterase/lipase
MTCSACTAWKACGAHDRDPLASLKKRTHGDLVRAVVSACNLIPGVFVFPVDVARVKGFKRTLGMPGTSDVLGWWQPPMRTPRCEWCNALRPVSVAFECKVGRDRLRPEQRAFLDKLRAAGGIAAEIRSADQAVNLLTSRR